MNCWLLLPALSFFIHRSAGSFFSFWEPATYQLDAMMG
jgi:hypothetical protein